MATFLLTALLALYTFPTSAIRIYSGTLLPTADSFSDNSKEISKRSWDVTEEAPKMAQPGLYKVKLTQNGYIQFLRYMVDVPPLQQYTFCIWMKSKNYTHNHPLLSYSMNEKDSIVRVWLSPSDASLLATIKGEPLFRIPLAVREGRWTHICQSWSGVTGEWAAFVDGKIRAKDIAHRHIGTFLPGGGDIAVGQDLPDFNKGLDDGVEGEIFGFNFVDEAVDIQELGILSEASTTQDKPHDVQIPNFKKLPANKKTFDDIKGYLAKLPEVDLSQAGGSTADVARFKEEIVPLPSTTILRTKPRTRGKAPVRKVVVYREDRMNEDNAQRRQGRAEETVNFIPYVPRSSKINQIYDSNYNMHAYKYSKKGGKISSYKTFEDPDEEFDRYTEDVAERRSDEKVVPGRRRPRHNFDVFSLREANRLHPFYAIPYEPHRTKYHFETEQQAASRRSFDVDDREISVTKRSPYERKNLPSVIPVHEEFDEGVFKRRRRDAEDAKRDARHITSGLHSNGFRPLPDLPPSFSQIFTSVPKEEILTKIQLFIQNNDTSVPSSTPLAPAYLDLTKGNDILQRRDPQNFPRLEDLLLAQAKRHPVSESTEPVNLDAANTRNAGSELVSRSYAICAGERGSPVSDKRHLLVSWADTPVRIYGGAMVITASNICGHF